MSNAPPQRLTAPQCDEGPPGTSEGGRQCSHLGSRLRSLVQGRVQRSTGQPEQRQPLLAAQLRIRDGKAPRAGW